MTNPDSTPQGGPQWQPGHSDPQRGLPTQGGGYPSIPAHNVGSGPYSGHYGEAGTQNAMHYHAGQGQPFTSPSEPYVGPPAESGYGWYHPGTAGQPVPPQPASGHPTSSGMASTAAPVRGMPSPTMSPYSSDSAYQVDQPVPGPIITNRIEDHGVTAYSQAILPTLRAQIGAWVLAVIGGQELIRGVVYLLSSSQASAGARSLQIQMVLLGGDLFFLGVWFLFCQRHDKREVTTWHENVASELAISPLLTEEDDRVTSARLNFDLPKQKDRRLVIVLPIFFVVLVLSALV